MKSNYSNFPQKIINSLIFFPKKFWINLYFKELNYKHAYKTYDYYWLVVSLNISYYI